MSTELQKYCIDNRIVNKNNKINNRMNPLLFDPLRVIYPNMPDKVIIDVIFSHDGIPPKCKHCNGDLDFFNLSNQRPISYAHSKCVYENRANNIDWTEAVTKRKKTNLERYGTESPFDYEKVVTKSKKTKLERYGSESYVNTKKIKETKLERYGDPNYRNDAKIRQTNLERYGHENPFGNESIIQKSSNTLSEKYGGRGRASPVISEKISRTNIERYGYENPMMCEEISEKSRLSYMKSYHTETNFAKLTSDIDLVYDEYVNDSSLSVSQIANDMGISKRTLLRRFHSNDKEILDRKYSNTTSRAEEELFNVISEIDKKVNIRRNDRKVLNPKEIDIWIPDYNIGIEYHGSYWHTEERVGDLHRTKQKLAKENNIRLIQIFDFEFEEKKEMFIDFIKSMMGGSQKIYARKCTLHQLNTDDERAFFEENHLQGYVPSKKCYGLYHNNDLICAMSFGKPRYNKKYSWEILRFCNKRCFSTIGGANKIWNTFLKAENVNNCITYSDPRFFDGALYESLGFDFVEHTESGYFWTNGSEVLKRYKTQKHKLIEKGFDENMSESEIMRSIGYYKVLDAGMLKFTFDANLSETKTPKNQII